MYFCKADNFYRSANLSLRMPLLASVRAPDDREIYHRHKAKNWDSLHGEHPDKSDLGAITASL